MDGAQFGSGGFGPLLDLRFVGDIHRGRGNTHVMLRQFRGDRFDAGLVDVGQRQMAPKPGQLMGQRPSNAASGARDGGHSAAVPLCKTAHNSSL